MDKTTTIALLQGYLWGTDSGATLGRCGDIAKGLIASGITSTQEIRAYLLGAGYRACASDKVNDIQNILKQHKQS